MCVCAVHVYTCVYVGTCTHVYACVYLCVCGYMHPCVYLCVCRCMDPCIYMCILCMQVLAPMCMHVYTYMHAVHAPMCMYGYSFVYVGACTMCMHMEARDWSQMSSPIAPQFIFLSQSLTEPGTQHLAKLNGQQAPGTHLSLPSHPTLIPPPTAGVTGIYHHTQLLNVGSSGSDLRFSCSWSKLFIPWATSQVTPILILMTRHRRSNSNILAFRKSMSY